MKHNRNKRQTFSICGESCATALGSSITFSSCLCLAAHASSNVCSLLLACNSNLSMCSVYIYKSR